MLRRSPPKLKVTRRADSLQSGFVSLGSHLQSTVDKAVGEAVRVLGGKPGQYHTEEAARRYPYGHKRIDLGGVTSGIIPRIYFSKTLPRKEDSTLPFNIQERYDYDARFPIGTGPMAVDEENRIIHAWSTEMESISESITRAMRGNPKYRRLCRPQYRFNHVSVHAYRAGNFIKEHEDNRRERRRRQRRNQVRNSMKEGSPVAVLTIGSRRLLSFYRKYDNGKEDVTEAEAAYEFEQTHGSLFVLDSLDEEPKCRRNMMGTRCDDALFLHSVKCPRDAGYFSVAFVFRCLDKTAPVDVNTDRVVPGAPKNEAERARREERARVRAIDNKKGSQFKKTVGEVQEEWRRLMRGHGWM